MSFIRKYNEDTKVWLMSDLHLGHDRDFVWAKRGLSNVQEHNEKLIENIRTCVEENDEFFILGDLTLGDLDAAAAYLRQIPGHVHVILGNHDTERRIEFYESLGWDVQFATVIHYGKQRFYLSHYPTNTANEGEDKLSLATVNLYGHTHQNWRWCENQFFSFCVCPEANNNYPLSLQEIIEYMKTMIITMKAFKTACASAEETGTALKQLAHTMNLYTLDIQKWQEILNTKNK